MEWNLGGDYSIHCDENFEPKGCLIPKTQGFHKVTVNDQLETSILATSINFSWYDIFFHFSFTRFVHPESLIHALVKIIEGVAKSMFIKCGLKLLFK